MFNSLLECRLANLCTFVCQRHTAPTVSLAYLRINWSLSNSHMALYLSQYDSVLSSPAITDNPFIMVILFSVILITQNIINAVSASSSSEATRGTIATVVIMAQISLFRPLNPALMV